MKKWKIINHKDSDNTSVRNSEFSIDFQNSSLWPYNFIFDRQRLYYDEFLDERWSYFFPLKSSNFENTEIFLETNDIAIALWERGSFSWTSRIFLEVVNLKTHNKYRLYPDEVSLIYNSQTSIVIYYKKSWRYKKLELNIIDLEKISETSVHLDAFFKLFYNHTDKSYGRLIYKANSRSHMAWYFIEEKIISQVEKPKFFNRKNFQITSYDSKDIDTWEASLTWKI